MIQSNQFYFLKNKRYSWHKRALLSGVLSVSVLNKWIKKEMDFLIRLALIENEPLVSPRACLGLIWTLFNTVDSTNFDKTIRSLKKLKDVNQIESFLILAFEATVSKSWQSEKDKSSQLNLIGSQLLEPFSEKSSFHEIDKTKFKSLKEKREFFKLLNASLSLSHNEKERVFLSVNRLKRNQIVDLIRIFHEEKTRFKKLSKEAGKQVTELTFNRGTEGVIQNLSNFPDYVKKLNKIITKRKTEEIAKVLYEVFQDDRLIKHLNFNELPKGIDNDATKLKEICHYLMANNKFKEAKRNYRKILKIDENDFTSLYNMGYIQSKLGFKKDAIKFYKIATKIKPDDASVHYNLGVVLENVGSNERALESYSASLEIIPDKLEALQNIALVQLKQNKSDEALLNMLKAVELKSDDPLIISQLASIYSEMGDFKKSLIEYNNALSLQPDFQPALSGRAWLYFTNRKYRVARQYFIENLKVRMNKHDIMNLGHCELVLYGENSALKYYEQSLDLWECSEEFFEGMNSDLKYLEKISKSKFEKIIQKLKKYCSQRLTTVE